MSLKFTCRKKTLDDKHLNFADTERNRQKQIHQQMARPSAVRQVVEEACLYVSLTILKNLGVEGKKSYPWPLFAKHDHSMTQEDGSCMHATLTAINLDTCLHVNTNRRVHILKRKKSRMQAHPGTWRRTLLLAVQNV